MSGLGYDYDAAQAKVPSVTWDGAAVRLCDINPIIDRVFPNLNAGGQICDSSLGAEQPACSWGEVAGRAFVFSVLCYSALRLLHSRRYINLPADSHLVASLAVGTGVSVSLFIWSKYTGGSVVENLETVNMLFFEELDNESILTRVRSRYSDHVQQRDHFSVLLRKYENRVDGWGGKLKEFYRFVFNLSNEQVDAWMETPVKIYRVKSK